MNILIWLLLCTCSIASITTTTTTQVSDSFFKEVLEFANWEQQNSINGTIKLKDTPIVTKAIDSQELVITGDPDDISVVAQGKPRWHIGAGVYLNKEIDYCTDSDDDDKKKLWFLPFSITGDHVRYEISPGKMVSHANPESHNLFTEPGKSHKNISTNFIRPERFSKQVSKQQGYQDPFLEEVSQACSLFTTRIYWVVFTSLFYIMFI